MSYECYACKQTIGNDPPDEEHRYYSICKNGEKAITQWWHENYQSHALKESRSDKKEWMFPIEEQCGNCTHRFGAHFTREGFNPDNENTRACSTCGNCRFYYPESEIPPRY